ncbi:ADP-ribosylation factor-like protein 14 isoform X1 [Selaginella moellendorffii]|uniref:ADP-ribosylation factor-like protein 14 isoform X1 n=1 Tax=Selaginella moellendorffii TaxID=88036 RepID=UPI000D1D09E8|nr:ADP-ribosylation factor-like protein 14 isoform X1 [Selaginella moellendorffii]|eukprot:XP_024538096.1 ADP-ribosylation factor-like protein 14 isoform X1 [Selaginella moellendorffii]
MPQESAGLVEWCCVWPFFATSMCCKDRKKIVIVLLGLDSSGKSTLLAKLRKEKFTSVLPTCGFSCKKWKIQDFAVYVFDLGGRKGFRGIWPHYFAEAYGAIFVLDSNDKARFSEAKEELHNAVSNTYLAGKPVLVVANKQGPGSAMRFDDIKFSLRSLEAAHNLAECKCNLQVNFLRTISLVSSFVRSSGRRRCAGWRFPRGSSMAPRDHPAAVQGAARPSRQRLVGSELSAASSRKQAKKRKARAHQAHEGFSETPSPKRRDPSLESGSTIPCGRFALRTRIRKRGCQLRVPSVDNVLATSRPDCRLKRADKFTAS